jgi:hypothetical protein
MSKCKAYDLETLYTNEGMNQVLVCKEVKVRETEKQRDKAISALHAIQSIINRHRTWTGMGWAQNPLASFVADKINKIIGEAVE